VLSAFIYNPWISPNRPRIRAPLPPGLWTSGIELIDLLCVREAEGLSIVSSAPIWWFDVHYITTCGGISIQDVHYFHAVLPALQPVAADMKRGKANCMTM